MDRRDFLIGSIVSSGAASVAVNYAAAQTSTVPVKPVIAHLADVAAYCRSQAKDGLSCMAAVREVLARYSVHPADPTTGYYARYTAPKNWDKIITDFWKIIPPVSHPTGLTPELLCYDYSDLMVMILGILGIKARTVRAIAINPLSFIDGYPRYLDHEFVEVWSGTKWSAQDAFYNVEYLLDANTYASVDDLCGAVDLNSIIVRNSAQTGWDQTGARPLATEDFFAAIEHRDTDGNSIVVMNGNRGDFGRLFCVAPNRAPTALRDLIATSTRHHQPTIIEIRAPTDS